MLCSGISVFLSLFLLPATPAPQDTIQLGKKCRDSQLATYTFHVSWGIFLTIMERILREDCPEKKPPNKLPASSDTPS